MKKMITFVLVVLFMLSGIAMAEADNEIALTLEVGGRTYAIKPSKVAYSTNYSRGMPIETIVADVQLEFGFDQDGGMVFTGTGTQPRSSINEDQTFLASAVRWNGSIVYNKMTIEGNTCYQPTSFTHKLTVLDGNFILSALNAYGGATGKGFDLANNNVHGSYSTGVKSLNITSPTSGQTYSKSLNNTVAFSKDSGDMIITTYGTFKYYRRNETGQPIRTSPEFEISLG